MEVVWRRKKRRTETVEDVVEYILPESAKGRGVMVSGTCVHGGGDFSCVDGPDS